MGLKNSRIAALLGASLCAPQILASDNISFYGTVATAYHSHQRAKIDTTDADVSSAVSRAGAWAPSQDQNYSVIGSGYTESNFGLDFSASEKVTGKLEIGTSLGEFGGDGATTVKKYYLLADLGVGSLKFGRDDRIFTSVAWYADSFTFGNLWYAGSVYGESRGTGISYESGELLGPIYLKLGLVNPTTGSPESKQNGGNPEPSVEASIGFHKDTFGVDLALVSEKRTVNYVAGADPTWDVANGLGYSLGVWANISMIEAALVYTGGDALYDSVTQGAMMSKDENDQMSAFAAYIKAKFGDASTAVYYGMQTLTHSKKNGAVDKNGSSKDIDDVGTTVGLNVSYDWKGLTFVGEAVNTTRAYDSETIENDTFFSVGATTSFSS